MTQRHTITQLLLILTGIGSIGATISIATDWSVPALVAGMAIVCGVAAAVWEIQTGGMDE